MAWFGAAGTQAVHDGLARLLVDLDQEVAAGRAVCRTSGRCCRFDTFGHRLYVTGLEIAWVLRLADKPAAPPAVIPAAAPGTTAVVPLPLFEHSNLTSKDGCPFQQDRLCTVHTIRPLGCRVFFCQEGTDEWQHELYERYLARLRRLHDEHAVDYQYMEWRRGLEEAQAIITAASRRSPAGGG